MDHDGAESFAFHAMAGEAPHWHGWRGILHQLVLDGAESSVVVHRELHSDPSGLVAIHFNRAGADDLVRADGIGELGECASTHEFSGSKDKFAQAMRLSGIVNQDIPSIRIGIAVTSFDSGDVGGGLFAK